MAKSIVKNAVYKVILSIFNIIVPIIVGSYAYRILGPTIIGRIGFVDSIYQYFFIFATFGIYQYGLREVSRVRDDKEMLSKLFTSLFIIGIITNICAVMVYIIFIIIQYKYSTAFPIFAIYSINMLCNIFYVEWANEALEKYGFITTKTVIVRIIYVILLFLLVKNPNNLLIYVLISTFTLFANYIVSFFYIKRTIKLNLKELSIKPHLKYLIMSVILANVNVLYTQLDRFSLGQYISENSVAYYLLAQQMMSAINAIMLSIIYVTVPRLSNYLGKNEEVIYVKLLNRVSKMYLAFLFPASIGLFVMAKEIVLLYGGSNFSSAIPLLKIFSFYMIAVGIESMLTNQVMYVKRKEKTLIIFILIGGVSNLLFKYILIKFSYFTAFSAVCTTLVAESILVLLEYIYIRTKLKIRFNLFPIDKFKYLLFSLLFIPTTLFLREFISSSIIMLFSGFIVNTTIYFTILAITKDKILNTLLIKLTEKLKSK